MDLWGWTGVVWGLEETVVYEVLDEMVNLNSRHFHTFSNHQNLKVACILHTSGWAKTKF